MTLSTDTSWPPRRRKLWHWLSDHGAPHWLWSRFLRDTWRRCEICGWRGVGHWKPAASYGGGLPPRHYCTHDCYYEREAF